MKLLFLNGPPRSGKDTAGIHLARERGNVFLAKFSLPLKVTVAGALGFRHGWRELDRFKDNPISVDDSRTFRQLQIEYFQFLQTNYGDDVLGKMAANDLLNMKMQSDDIVVFTDAGRFDEVEYMVHTFGKQSCALVSVYREGTDYSNDIRDRLTEYHAGILGIPHLNLYNEGDIDNYRKSVDQCFQLIDETLIPYIKA